jgi:hypothetical protein
MAGHIVGNLLANDLLKVPDGEYVLVESLLGSK